MAVRGSKGGTTRRRGSRVAAGSVAAVAILWITTTVAAAAFGRWGSAVSVESIAGTSAQFNTPYLDGCPIQAPDGLSFYMATNRPGGAGGIDIWVAHRTTTSAPWGAPVNLGTPVNSAADDFCPTPVRGKRLFFVSSRPGGCGGADIYVTRRDRTGTWDVPTNLGCTVNSPAGEASPSLITAGPDVLYFSSSRAGGFAPEVGTAPDSDIYVSALGAGGAFGAPELAPGVNTSSEDARPNVRKDGLEIVFDSNRPGTLGGPDIYSATRAAVGDAWSVPTNLGAAINTASSESRASLSWDGSTLVFGSNRPGSEPDPVTGAPSNDIYTSTRAKTGGGN